MRFIPATQWDIDGKWHAWQVLAIMMCDKDGIDLYVLDLDPPTTQP
jgi:hypothetical protein